MTTVKIILCFICAVSVIGTVVLCVTRSGIQHNAISKFSISDLMNTKFERQISNDIDMDLCKVSSLLDDIVEPPKKLHRKTAAVHTTRHKRAVKPSATHGIWEYGIIPFEIDPDFGGSHRLLFQQAMRHWENHTCIKFIERQPKIHPHYLYFTVLSCGCCSFVGKRGHGGQTVSIGKNCDKFGVVVHELGHVIGFWHEHTRPDRDLYVRIETENIMAGQEFNFNKQQAADINMQCGPYDYGSIMHYAADTFALPYTNTIVPLHTNGTEIPKIGQRVKLSDGDIRRANLLYSCPMCGSTFLQHSVSFSSNTYYQTGNVDKGQQCEWRIVTTHGENIILNILSMNLIKSEPNCSTEYLEIQDGYWWRSPIIGRYCDFNEIPKEIRSTSNRMLLRLLVSNTVPQEQRGFTAKYESVCGGKLLREGRLQSPNYPSQYPNSKECIWEVSVQPGYQVALVFQSFEMEYHDRCAYDYVEVWDGDPANDTLMGRFCGHEMPPDITASSNKMWIKFVSDGSGQKTGFSAIFVKEINECLQEIHGCEHECKNTLGGYECSCHIGFELHSNHRSCEHACGGQLIQTNGTITSPSFPQVYPKNKYCVWDISVPRNHRVTLNFTHFDLESDPAHRRQECDYDYLQIFSIYNKNKFRSHGKLCGMRLPSLITSMRNAMRLVFQSDKTIQKSGFALIFYSEFNECTVNKGGCEQECRKTLGSFKCLCTNGYVLHPNGFNCTIGGCNYKINADDGGYITTPNYPKPYPANADCVWLITSTPGHRVILNFTVFDIEFHPECATDFVDIFKGSSKRGFKLGRFCGNASVPWIGSPINEMLMIFRSDQNGQGKGFRAEISTACGGRLSAIDNHVKRLFSHPEFGISNYENNVQCDWIIEAQPGQSVHITFVAFHIESGDKCDTDFVEIREENLNDGVYYGRFCGQDTPPIIVSTRNTILIRFCTDSTVGKPGFSVEYVEVDGLEYDDDYDSVDNEDSEENTRVPPFPGYIF